MSSEQDFLEISRASSMSDDQDFIILMRQNQESVYRLAFYLLGNEEEARDATQETFIKTWRNLKNLQWETSQEWILKTTANLCFDWLRRRKFREDFQDKCHVNSTMILSLLPDPKPGPLEQCMNQEIQAKVREATLNLPPSYRIVVILRDMEGLSYQEISEMLNIPVSKVKSDLFRGRRKLREVLRPLFEVSRL